MCTNAAGGLKSILPVPGIHSCWRHIPTCSDLDTYCLASSGLPIPGRRTLPWVQRNIWCHWSVYTRMSGFAPSRNIGRHFSDLTLALGARGLRYRLSRTFQSSTPSVQSTSHISIPSNPTMASNAGPAPSTPQFSDNFFSPPIFSWTLPVSRSCLPRSARSPLNDSSR